VVQAGCAVHAADRGNPAIEPDDVLHVPVGRGFEKTHEAGGQIDQRLRVEVLIIEGLHDLLKRDCQHVRLFIVQRYLDADIRHAFLEL